MDAGGPGPYGGSEPSAVGSELPLLLGHVASPDPSQSWGRVRGRWPGEVGAWPMGPAAPPLMALVADDYPSSSLL